MAMWSYDALSGSDRVLEATSADCSLYSVGQRGTRLWRTDENTDAVIQNDLKRKVCRLSFVGPR